MKKRHEAINERNAKILALYIDGVAVKQIAKAVRGSLGVVAGIVHRAGIKNRGGTGARSCAESMAQGKQNH